MVFLLSVSLPVGAIRSSLLSAASDAPRVRLRSPSKFRKFKSGGLILAYFLSNAEPVHRLREYVFIGSSKLHKTFASYLFSCRVKASTIFSFQTDIHKLIIVRDFCRSERKQDVRKERRRKRKERRKRSTFFDTFFLRSNTKACRLYTLPKLESIYSALRIVATL